MNIFDPNNKTFSVHPALLIFLVLFAAALVATHKKEKIAAPNPPPQTASAGGDIISITELSLDVVYEVVTVNNLGKSPIPHYAGSYEVIAVVRDTASGKETKVRVYEKNDTVMKPSQRFQIMKGNDGQIFNYWMPDERPPSNLPSPKAEPKPITANFRKEVVVFFLFSLCPTV